MFDRRKLLRSALTASVAIPMMLSRCSAAPGPQDDSKPSTKTKRAMDQVLRMPDESEPHECTWMAFGVSEEVWGKKLADEARRNLAAIAQAVARFEPVVMCVRPEERKRAKSSFKDLKNIEWFECPLDDLWIRDSGPVFVLDDSGEKFAIDFNFNGWGEKQEYANDCALAAAIAEHCDVPLIETDICLEGGGIEVDGHGTAIITESCVLNPNRNPQWSKQDCEDELAYLLGLKKIIWLPGVRDADITDGHTDFYARFASPGVVMAHLDWDDESPEFGLTRKHLQILQQATDTAGKKLEVVTLEPPRSIRDKFANDDFCAGYINYYVCNGAVIAPEFGDQKADDYAKSKLNERFPGREIVLLNIDGIAAGGGGIHCATQQEPRG